MMGFGAKRVMSGFREDKMNTYINYCVKLKEIYFSISALHCYKQYLNNTNILLFTYE